MKSVEQITEELTKRLYELDPEIQGWDGDRYEYHEVLTWRHPSHKLEHARKAAALLQEVALNRADAYKESREYLARALANPPAGWFVFGYHVNQPDVELEFWGDAQSEDGLPIWERPKTEGNA